MKTVRSLFTFFIAGASAFAPPRPAALTSQSTTSPKKTEMAMIGGLLQGLFGKSDAEITDTVYFDVSIAGEPAGRIEMGLYGSTVPKVRCLGMSQHDGSTSVGGLTKPLN